MCACVCVLLCCLCVCVRQAYMCMLVCFLKCALREDRGQCWVSSFITIPLTFWDRVSYWTWSSRFGTLTGKASYSLWGYRCKPLQPTFFLYGLGRSEIRSLCLCNEHDPRSHIPSCTHLNLQKHQHKQHRKNVGNDIDCNIDDSSNKQTSLKINHWMHNDILTF